ncbi:MAG: regulator of sigma protease [Candidatus Parcubacteria bacterium]|jgi:regulator of sigma E protease|nr:regulator of sigma protease [Candidatus Parcubacteria bacterium]
MTVIIFIIVLAVLIFVHELGHFVVARANGIRVDEFKIGFGPRLISWGSGETKYGLNLIPFGGYVKIHGENPDDDSINGPDRARSFVHKNRFKQAAVLFAGVFFNFLFAWLLYVAVFVSGVTATTEGFERYADDFKNPRIMVTYVAPGSPAEKAGLGLGDVIQGVSPGRVEGNALKPKQSISDIQNSINESKGGQVMLGYIHRGELKTAPVTPTTGLIEGKYAVGIAMQDVADLRLPFFTSIYEGARYTGFITRDTAVGLYTFIANIFRGTANFADVAGPVGIAGIVGNAAELGFTYLLMITALISVNLGVINLIPFPALDGGRILLVAIEGLFRRKIPAKFANAVNTAGFALLMLLMVVVTYKDIARLMK